MNHIGTDLELMQIFETGEVVWLAKSNVWTIINQDTSTLMVWEESSHSVPTSSPLHVSPLTHNCTSKLSFPHLTLLLQQDKDLHHSAPGPCGYHCGTVLSAL